MQILLRDGFSMGGFFVVGCFYLRERDERRMVRTVRECDRRFGREVVEGKEVDNEWEMKLWRN